MITIKDIAREVGVSTSTVSRALSGSPLISATTARRVKEAADKLGYERNELARGLVIGASGAIGLIVPDITNPFFSDIARGVGEIAVASRYGVILCNTAERVERELHYMRLMRRKRVDGLILSSATVDDPVFQLLTEARIPFILVSRLSGDLDVPYVVVDDKLGARLAVKHLTDLGHRKIGFIGGPPDVRASQDRADGYREVLRENGLTVREQWVCFAGFTQAAGREAGQRILALADRPTAIFAANDVTALGVLEVADGLGMDVPGDLSLVGYDDISYAALPRIQLTTVAQPAFEMGQISAEWLISIVEGRSRPVLRRVITPRLMVRSTTAPLA
jgi:LacI family transcriptional regulator